MTSDHAEPRVLLFRIPPKPALVPQYDWDGGPGHPPGKPMRPPFLPPPADIDAAAEQRLAA
jgi:hypothetical protein